MKTYLWAQNDLSERSDSVYENGVECLEKEKSQRIFSRINKKNQNLFFSEKERIEIQQKYGNENISNQSNLKAFKNIKEPKHISIYIQGCFLDRDSAGRLLPFMFYCETDSIETFQAFQQAKQAIMNLASQIDRKCNELELDILWKEAVNKSKRQNQKKWYHRNR